MTTGVLLDTNLLCLLVVGRIDRHSIARHSRLRAFEEADFNVLIAIIDRLGDPVLCPHVLAETSNLLSYRQTSKEAQRWRRSLAELTEMAAEESEAARKAAFDTSYLRLGLTDAVLLMLSTDHDLVLVSDDLHLCLEAERRGLRAVNYNYLRDGALRIDQL